MDTNERREALIKARDKIANEESWTKGSDAKDAKDHSVGFRSEEAVKWCLFGAIRAVEDSDDLIFWVGEKASSKLPKGKVCGIDRCSCNITTFNDTGNHERVIGFLNEMIEE